MNALQKIKNILKSNYFIRKIYYGMRYLYYRCQYYFNAVIRKVKSDGNRFYGIKNYTKNKRCFIIGNGPSLRISDLEKLKNEDSFAVNRIFKIFDKTTWRPTYYCAHDTKVLNETISSLNDVLCECDLVFINSAFKGKAKFSLKKFPFFFYGIQKEFYPEMPCFSEDISKGINEGYTVTYSCIQLAAYMGYKEIYLLGLDHSYKVEKKADGSIKNNDNVKENYMHGLEGANYFLPQLDKTELAYKKAKLYCEEHGIVIKNATRGGMLEIFDRVDFDSLF